MIEPVFSVIRFTAYAAWGLVGTIVMAAWVVLVAGHPTVAAMLGFTGCAISAVAATLTIRCWIGRVCQVVRTAVDRASVEPGVVPFR